MKPTQLISTYPLSFPTPEKPYHGPTFDRSGHQSTFDELRDQRESEVRRSRTPTPPPHCNTGGKLTDPATGYEVSIDWIRMSGPVEQRREALEVLAGYLGNPTLGKGLHLMNAGYRFGSAGLYFDRDEVNGKQHCVVELPGTSLHEINPDDHIQLITKLHALGFKTTRIDVAVDLYAHFDLIETMTESCHSGELCRAKRYEPKFIKSGQAITGHGCNVGARGKVGSGRYLRVYDKGIETQEQEIGHWVRWEAEFAHEPAQEVSLAIAEAQSLARTGVKYAFGVCDFRENTGSKHLSRRPRAKWFEDLLQMVETERPVRTKEKSTLHSFKLWMQTSVLPKLETLTVATGQPMHSLLNTLFGDIEPDAEHLEDPKVRTLCIEAGGDPSHALQKLNNRRLVMIAVEEGTRHAC